MLKVSDNPPARWPNDRPIAADVGNWWVVRVKPRAEKALAWDLAEKGISYYLPMFTKRTIRRDNHKTRKSLICMFSGYISLTNWHDHREAILRTGRVLKVIPVYDQDKFARELENIAQALTLVQDLEVHPCLAKGQRVIIAEGPMAGIEGVVNDVSQPGRVFLNVEMFNRAVVVKVAPNQLIVADDRLTLPVEHQQWLGAGG